MSSSIVSSNSARVSLLDAGQHGRRDLLQLVQQLDREAGEVVDEVQRVLDLVSDAGGELAERGHLLGLDQVGLGRLQALQRVAQLGEQPHVLDGDHRLRREGFEQFDLVRRERSWCRPAEQDAANRLALAKHGRRQQRTDAGPSGKLYGHGVLRWVERSNVGDVKCLPVDGGATRGGTAVKRKAGADE